MGPTVSSDGASGALLRGRSGLGSSSSTTPQDAAGIRMDPPVSLPYADVRLARGHRYGRAAGRAAGDQAGVEGVDPRAEPRVDARHAEGQLVEIGLPTMTALLARSAARVPARQAASLAAAVAVAAMTLDPLVVGGRDVDQVLDGHAAAVAEPTVQDPGGHECSLANRTSVRYCVRRGVQQPACSLERVRSRPLGADPPVPVRGRRRGQSGLVVQAAGVPDRRDRSSNGAARTDVPYAELHCHSNFSFLDGASHPEELVEEAARLGLEALALTDHDGMYGVVRFAEAARAVGMPTVFGAELSLGLSRPQNGVADPEGPHLLVLARDATGYARLCRALSIAQMAGREKGRPLIDSRPWPPSAPGDPGVGSAAGAGGEPAARGPRPTTGWS